ncbi:MAG: hypothetical protein AB1791_22815 [Chloroflexota bacterium]
MTEITLTVPDEVAERLKVERDRLPELLALIERANLPLTRLLNWIGMNTSTK